MLTQEQREVRRMGLGASDMAAVMGLNPFTNSAEVFLEKTNQLIEAPETSAMYLGTKMEHSVLDYAEDELGPLDRSFLVRCPDKEVPLASNLDAMVVETQCPVEAKTSGEHQKLWGEEGTDQVPDYIIIQCQVQIYCTESDLCHVPALLGGKGLKLAMYKVQRDDALIKAIKEEAMRFWYEHVLLKVPPPDVTANIEVLKRVRREPDKTVDIASELVQKWLDAKDDQKAAEFVKDDAQASLISALGDAEAGRCALGLFRYIKENAGMKVKAKDLKEKYPDVYAELAYASTRMMSRFKKG